MVEDWVEYITYIVLAQFYVCICIERSISGFYIHPYLHPYKCDAPLPIFLIKVERTLYFEYCNIIMDVFEFEREYKTLYVEME